MLWLVSIKGSSLFWEEMTSPLMLAVIAIVIIPIVAYYALAARSGSERAKARARLGLATALAALAIVAGVNYYTLQPGQTYGLEVSGNNVTLHYYENRAEQYNLCNSTLRLVSADEARNMLSVRTYGTSDPLTGLAAGEFKLVDGRSAHVLIVPGARKALIIEERGKPVAILGAPGAEKALKSLESAKAEACG